MYIPFEGSGAHDRLMYQIASSLDKALNISLGKANATVQHVFKMTLVSGLPFYGFHTKEHQYFKIYFYNPLMVKKAAELLQSGAILNKIYQPHEAHLPYILQFMIDYNLYGMNHVNLKNVKFRRDPENPGSFECLSEEILLPERVSRLSTCETEADAMAADIINRTAVSDQLALNPGLAAIWEDEKQRRREGGRTSQITPQSSRERPFAASTDSALFFKQKLHEKLLLLNSQLSNNSSTLLDTPEVTKTPYPAETSEDSELLEASFVDLHIQSSGSSPFIRSGQMEQDDNASFVDEDLVLSLLSSQRRATHNSVWMDSQDEELTAVLHNLENIADIDEDSILGSQICQELQDEEIHGCDDEDMQDFSEPLDAVLDCYTDDYHQKENVKRSLSLATEQNMVYNEENCQLDISHKLNISRSESSKSLESDNTSVKSMCSCPIRSEARKDDGSQLCACPQRRHGACNRGVNVPTLHCAENMEQLLAESSGGTVSKTVRKQPKSPFLGSHIENGLYLSTQENDCKNISQGSVKVYANGERTSRNSASVIVDFPERKRIVKQRKILDMFVAEDDMSSKALSPRMTVKEGSFLCEGLTEQKLHNSNSLYITQMPEINSYERNETLKTSSLDSDSDGVRSRHTEKVEQHTEDWCNFNDEEELEEGILSYYNETISYSATASAEFEEFMVKPPVPANNSSKHEMNLECALFMRMEQNSLGNVAETHNVINQTPLTEHLCRNESHFRIVTTAHKNFRVYIPRFNPPSKNEILASLSEFCIPEYRHQEPFVGNVLDIGNKIEVGSKVLKICSMSVCDLQPFAGSLQDILDIETWRRKLLQELSYTSQGSLDQSSDFGLDNMKPALASNREVVITPCKLPPSITEVNLWPKAAQKSNVQELQGNDVGDDVSSRRIMMPLSPGQESGSDDMSFLPVTPGSLRSEQNGRGNVTTTHSTPQVTLASAYLPSPSCTPIHNSSQNRTKMLLKRSRKGLKFDPQTQENVSFMLPSIREEPEEAAVDTILKCGAAKENPISSDSSELPHFYDNSGPYKHQDSDGRSEVIRSVEQVQPENAIDLISSSQGTVEAEPVRKLLLHHQLHPVTTTQRAVEGVNSSCQIEESTPNNTYGFQVSLQNLHEVKAICEYQFLTMFIMELHIHTRGDLKPDPSYDPIRALFYMVVNDIPEDAGLSKHELAVIVVYTLDGDVKIPLLNMNENCKVTYVEDEASLVHELVKCVKKWDPDILGGYEVEMLSWGYLFQRAYTLQINLGPLVSRVPTASHQHTGNESATSNFHEEIRLTGRIMLNIWRLMRHEVALQSYTFENVVFHVLHQRIPLHSFKHLTNCWEHRMHLYRSVNL
ncbi:DNA polymerase zeta catalytic subunit isoform X3 [Cryptotermes secundus]|nr:DNA polymerase zeta catalytic subunit isoform X3 [Cryptotermes secundus]